MQFGEILKADSAARVEGSLPDILGDAFLTSENAVYRRVKTHAAKIGITFSEATARYLLLPFQQLDGIVSAKSVPYVPHGRMMAEIEAKYPGLFNLEQMPMPESYHLHEAAHVIAGECCAKIEVASPQDQILKALLCESFSNTVDAMACGYADSPIHRLFLQLNCYMLPTEEVYELIRGVREEHGDDKTARLILVSYLHANFLREEVPQECLASGMTDDNCLMLSTIGQELDIQFRVQTTQNYFHLAGIKGELVDLLDFDFVQLLERKDFVAAVNALVAVVST